MRSRSWCSQNWVMDRPSRVRYFVSRPTPGSGFGVIDFMQGILLAPLSRVKHLLLPRRTTQGMSAEAFSNLLVALRFPMVSAIGRLPEHDRLFKKV